MRKEPDKSTNAYADTFYDIGSRNTEVDPTALTHNQVKPPTREVGISPVASTFGMVVEKPNVNEKIIQEWFERFSRCYELQLELSRVINELPTEFKSDIERLYNFFSKYGSNQFGTVSIDQSAFREIVILQGNSFVDEIHSIESILVKLQDALNKRRNTEAEIVPGDSLRGVAAPSLVVRDRNFVRENIFAALDWARNLIDDMITVINETVKFFKDGK